MICPLNYNVFKTLMMKSNKFYTEEDIDLLYKASKREEHIGGNKQLDGLKCLTFHNIYKIIHLHWSNFERVKNL